MKRTWTATDACGNTATVSQTITVQDITPPVLTCPESTIILTGAYVGNNCSYQLGQDPASAVDNCGSATLSYSLSGATTGVLTTLAGVSLNAGVTTVSVLATDACGNTSTCTITYSVSCPPLPVVLEKFELRRNDKGNLLTWKTSSETNFSHFEIEKSIKNNTFETIGKVGSHSNKENSNYQFLDTNQAIDAYYRLKMIDLDGTINYSKILFIEGKKPIFEVLRSYPNPSTNDYVYVDIVSGKSTMVTIELVDISGKVISNGQTLIQEGSNTIKINKVPKGISFVKFITEKNSFVKKILRLE